MKLGTLVLYHYSPTEFAPNDATTVPAIIVRVHDEYIVNLRLFGDSIAHGAEYRPQVPRGPLAVNEQFHYWTPMENGHAEG